MRVKNTFLLSLLILFCFHINAQQKTLRNETNKNGIKLFFEKAYLQVDRSYYSTGEDLWFGAYLVNGKSTSLTSTSNNLYVELISPKSSIVDQKLIRLDAGLGKGDFKLNDSIPSGWYNIRAYTNWMRNFGNDFVFQKSIYITNNVVENASYFTRTGNKKENISVKNNKKKSIAFFPEGGSLVAGVNSLVAFKTNDDFGNGLAAKGSVISSSGDTVATFKSTDAGMGIFAFLPVENEKYKVEGFFGKENFTSDMPEVRSKGLVLHVSTDSLNIRIAINANESTFKELIGKSLSLVVKHAGDIVYTGTIIMSKASLSVAIPLHNLPAGIAVVTVIDDKGRPNCERLTFIPGDEKINFTVTPNKAVYKPREKVILTIRAKNVLGQPAKTNLSLAAVDDLIPDDGSNLVSYFLLQSEIKGEIKNADQYFDPKNPSRFSQLDLLLLTQGWRDYVWLKLADSAINISYLPEPGISLKGSVREKLVNKPMPDMNITLFGSGFTGDKLFTTKTDANGYYFLDGLNWVGNQSIKISSQDAKGKKGGWLQIDSAFKAPLITMRNTNDKDIPLALNLEIGKRMALNRTYKFGDSITLSEVQIQANKNQKLVLFNETLTTFGYPDQVFNISAADYSYKGLEHFLLTKAKGAQSIDDMDTTGNEGVAFFSNGSKIRPRIIINNREDLFERLDYYSLTMDQINQIIVKHLINNSGNDVYVISLNLKDSALKGPNMNLLNINLNGYYAARTFYSPNYNNPASTNKDFRTTVFWSPFIKTNENGEATVTYFNGDNKSNIVIKANGITESGIAVSTKNNYKVQ